MNNYIATFYTHYGAMKFNKICKNLNIEAKMMPVPRKLSSSCGTCVFFISDSYEFINNNAEIEDLENCYSVLENNYIKLKVEQ